MRGAPRLDGESSGPAGGSADPLDLVIRAPRAIVDGHEVARAIGVRGGRIVALEPIERPVWALRVIELDTSTVLLPGMVDTHVHVCEPGNTDWEGFASATRAAAAGGITTLVDMPLDSVPTTVDVAALETKRRAAEGQCVIDVGFWGGVIPGNESDLRPLHEAGVLGFKAFLVDSGSPDFPPIDRPVLEAALRTLRELGAPLLVHAEDAGLAADAPVVHGRHYADFLATRPRVIEDRAVATVIEATRQTDGRAHVLHLSSANALSMIRAAQDAGIRISAETCPHYLALAAEEIRDGATAFKCLPPIREQANQELLWDGLARGTLTSVVSDHSPCTIEMKELTSGDFALAWGGISSLQLSLPVVWTAARRRGRSLADVVGWMSEGPAGLAGLKQKGAIALGRDADFCVFAPDESFQVDPLRLYHRNPVTPYAGRRLHGVVRSTILRGVPVDSGSSNGEFLTGAVTPSKPAAGTRS